MYQIQHMVPSLPGSALDLLSLQLFQMEPVSAHSPHPHSLPNTRLEDGGIVFLSPASTDNSHSAQKEARIYSEENIDFSISSIGKARQLHVKEWN